MDLSRLWTAAEKNGSLNHQMWNDPCVLVDDDRVYAVHKDVEDTSLSRLAVVDRDTGVGLWTSEAYGSSGVDCPVLVDDMVVVPVGYSPTLDQPTGLLSLEAATGDQVWSRQFTGGGWISQALATDGTRVFGSAAGLTGCPFSSFAAWSLATGALEWCVAGSQPEGAPLVADGVVIQGNRSEPGLYALDPADGSTLWSDAEANGLYGVAGDGGQVAYAARTQLGVSKVRLVDAVSGVQQWQFAMPFGQNAGRVVLDSARVYVASTLTNGGNIRLRAFDRGTGSVAWGPLSGEPTMSQHLYLLGDKVLAGSITADRASGTLSQDSYNWGAMPENPSFADGTIYGWVQNSDGTWSVGALRDTTKPTVGVLAPATGTLTTDNTPSLAFTPGDGVGTGVAATTVILDGIRHDATGTTTFTPDVPLTDGSHTWAMEVVDAAGNTTAPEPRTLTVDTTAPEAFAVTAPVAHGTVDDATPDVMWEPTTDATSGVDHYEVFVDGTLTQEVSACTTACATDLANSIGDGAHEISVVAVDAAGHRRSSGPVPFTVAAPPSAALTSTSAYALTGTAVTFDAGGSTDNGTDLTYAWDVNGDGDFVVGAAQRSVSFGQVGLQTVSVRVSDGELTDIAQVEVDVRAMPPAGEVGVSINGGAYATNDPNVQISLVWRKLDVTALLSNDGGFDAAGNATSFDVTRTLDWTLATEGPERLPKTVWARLKGRPGAEDRDLTDDIILDTTNPVVDGASFVTSAKTTAFARLASRRIRFRASDNAAGVRAVQVTNDKSRPGTKIKVPRSRSATGVVTANVGRGAVYFRVVDTAQNPSAWRRVR